MFSLDTNADKEKSAVTGEEDTENTPMEKKIEEKKAPIKVNTGKHPSLLKVCFFIIVQI